MLYCHYFKTPKLQLNHDPLVDKFDSLYSGRIVLAIHWAIARRTIITAHIIIF